MKGEATMGFTPEFGAVYRIGKSYYGCGNLTDGMLDPFLALIGRRGIAPSMMYSDPPWGQGNATSWSTKARKFDPEAKPTNPFEEVLLGVAGAARWMKGKPTFIEMGYNWQADLEAVLNGAGLWPSTWGAITYYRTKPCLLCHVGSPSTARGTVPVGMDDMHTPGWAIGLYSNDGDTVLDITCGQGLTSTSAFRIDRHFVGFEMNVMRLGRTMDAGIEHYGEQPEMVGRVDGR